MADALAGAPRRAGHARREPAAVTAHRERHARGRRRARWTSWPALERRRGAGPALRARQRGRALRGRPRRRDRRPGGPGRRAPARRRAQARRRPVGRHRLLVLPGRRRQPGQRACRWPGRPSWCSATATWPRAGSSNLTFAQPFTLDLGHGATVTAAAADSTLERTASPPTRPTRCSGPSSCSPGSRSSTSRTPSSARPAGSS